jgi:hypothetical protein
MMQNHRWTIGELEQMMPWERRVYIAMLIKWIKDENERNEEHKNAINSMRK